MTPSSFPRSGASKKPRAVHIDPRPDMAVLVPAQPSADMMHLLIDVGIAAIWKHGRHFVEQ